jgi:hypothetical protein
MVLSPGFSTTNIGYMFIALFFICQLIELLVGVGKEKI